jgi:hypothetical protein
MKEMAPCYTALRFKNARGKATRAAETAGQAPAFRRASAAPVEDISHRVSRALV